MKIDTDINKINEILNRGVEEVIDCEHLRARLLAGKPLRIKLGIDPTSPNIHIGRAVVLWKLRAFQELGHRIVFIVGDFTGLIGDTSDKDSERPMLDEKTIKANLKSYFAQAARIIDPKKAEMHYNSKWLKKLGFLDIGRLADLFGLHEMAARENIAVRFNAGKRVSFRELLYPLMQGYDSVAVKADVELGGTDQRFNLLAGRTIQKAYGQEPQDILMTQLMEGTDGRKMSSSWGNVVNITDAPNNMFGKIMSIPDSLIQKYFILTTRLSLPEISEIVKLSNPRDQKIRLAFEITSLYYGGQKAEAAQEAFVNQFSKGELPEEIEEKNISQKAVYKLHVLLKMVGLAESKSEARRLILQRGVRVNGVVSDDVEISIDGKKEYLIQVGKLKILKVK